MRRTSGDDLWRPFPDVSYSGAGAVLMVVELLAVLSTGGVTAACLAVAAAGISAEADWPSACWLATPGADAASPACPIVPTTLLTGTVSPSFTLMSVRTPAAGEGISASTLSVEISKSGSSRSTGSPTFLIHRTIVPSAIDSPIWGITTGVAIRNLSTQSSGLKAQGLGLRVFA